MWGSTVGLSTLYCMRLHGGSGPAGQKWAGSAIYRVVSERGVGMGNEIEMPQWTREGLEQRIGEGEQLLVETPGEWGWTPIVVARLRALRNDLLAMSEDRQMA